MQTNQVLAKMLLDGGKCNCAICVSNLRRFGSYTIEQLRDVIANWDYNGDNPGNCPRLPSNMSCDETSPEPEVFFTPASDNLDEPLGDRTGPDRELKSQDTEVDLMYQEIKTLPYVRIFKHITDKDEMLKASGPIMIKKDAQGSNGLHELGEAVDPTYSREIPRWILPMSYWESMDDSPDVDEFFNSLPERGGDLKDKLFVLADKPYYHSKMGFNKYQNLQTYIKDGNQDIIIFRSNWNNYSNPNTGGTAKKMFGLTKSDRHFFHDMNLKAVWRDGKYTLRPFTAKDIVNSHERFSRKTGLIRVHILSGFLEQLDTLGDHTSAPVQVQSKRKTHHHRPFMILELMNAIDRFKNLKSGDVWRPTLDHQMPIMFEHINKKFGGAKRETDKEYVKKVYDSRQQAFTHSYYRFMLEAKAAFPKLRSLVKSGKFADAGCRDLSKEEWRGNEKKEWELKRPDCVKAAKNFMKFLRDELKTFDADKAREYLNPKKEETEVSA